MRRAQPEGEPPADTSKAFEGAGNPAQVESQQENRAGREAGTHTARGWYSLLPVRAAGRGCSNGPNQGKLGKAWNNSEHEYGSTFFWQAGASRGLAVFLIHIGLMFGIMYYPGDSAAEAAAQESAGDAGRREERR